jgi:hypothetical protein
MFLNRTGWLNISVIKCSFSTTAPNMIWYVRYFQSVITDRYRIISRKINHSQKTLFKDSWNMAGSYRSDRFTWALCGFLIQPSSKVYRDVLTAKQGNVVKYQFSLVPDIAWLRENWPLKHLSSKTPILLLGTVSYFWFIRTNSNIACSARCSTDVCSEPLTKSHTSPPNLHYCNRYLTRSHSPRL